MRPTRPILRARVSRLLSALTDGLPSAPPLRRASRAGAAVLLGTVGLFLVGCAHGQGAQPSDGPAAEGEAAEQAEGADQEKEDEGPFEPWDEVLEDTREIEGFIPVHLKRDNTLYLEIAPERLGEDFGMLTHFSRGLGDLAIQEGLPAGGDTDLLRFRREGDRIHLVKRNPRFTADEGSAMETSLEGNVGHSVLAAFDIESENDSTGHFLVDATSFFVSDYTATGQTLTAVYGDKPVRLDDDRSHVDEVQGFPENVEIDALLTYTADEPPAFGGPGVSDVRSIPVGIRYSLFELPEDPMTRRPADQRVGHFLTTIRDFSRDREETTYLRFVNRWRLEKEDDSQALSEPVEPIVFYIDRSVPERYRPWVREGIEAWNEAFREAGFENAVVAKVAPTAEEDSTWSAEDVRYSTVRWTAAQNMGFAIGPSQVDPRTGEILNADILISWSFVRGWKNEFESLVADGGAVAPGASAGAVPGPDEPGTAGRPVPAWGTLAGPARTALRGGPAGALRQLRATRRALMSAGSDLGARLCTAELHKARELGVQYAVLASRGAVEPGEEMPEDYLGAALRELVMHEVGHTLGLRHNFRASSDIPYDRLHDEDFTREHGVSLSVMEYNPVNVSLDPDDQGHYWNPSVGAYDEWAVEYAYVPVYEQGDEEAFPASGEPVRDFGAQRRALSKIADESDDPYRAYATDEDARFGPYAVDPLANTGDLGSDPLLFARDRSALVDEVLPELDSRVVEAGRPWHRLRDAVSYLYFAKWTTLLSVPKTVGGLHTARDYKGQPGGRPTFRPVPAEEQRAAVRLLAEEAFSEDAFSLDPETHNRLAPDWWWDWRRSFTDILPLDYPVHREVAFFQGVLLDDLFHPERLHRIVDGRVRAEEGGDAFRMSELFGTVADAVWSEVRRPQGTGEIGSMRRNLQRLHLERMVTLLLHEQVQGIGGTVSVPEDARSLARAELADLSDELGRALRTGGLSAMTEAHLSESKARIDRALEASLSLGPEG